MRNTGKYAERRSCRLWTAQTDRRTDRRADGHPTVTRGSCAAACHVKKGNGNPYSITERRVLELIPVLCSQPAGDLSHKPGGRLPLLSARPAVTPATLKRAATNFAA